MYSCSQSMMGLVVGLVSLIGACAAAADDRNAAEELAITLKLVHEQQRPVVGAEAAWIDEVDKSATHGGSFDDSRFSDEAGIVRVRFVSRE